MLSDTGGLTVAATEALLTRGAHLHVNSAATAATGERPSATVSWGKTCKGVQFDIAKKVFANALHCVTPSPVGTRMGTLEGLP